MKHILHILVIIIITGLTGCKKDEDPASTANNSNVTPLGQTTTLKVGVFSGQNGYATSGSVEVIRDSAGAEYVRTKNDFRVSGGAGTITIWLTNQNGAANLNSTTTKVEVGVITSGFSGVYAFRIPASGSGSYTHVVSFCHTAQINFGNAALQNP